jgi:hypothetical protein
MKWDRLLCVFVTVHLTCILAASAQTTNSWTPGADGKWEIGDNWSTGTPTNSNGANLITNATTKAVTVDATTVASNGLNGCMTISNLVVSGLVGTINMLQLTNAGVATPLTVLSSATISSGGALLVTNASLQLKVGTGHNLLINGTADLRDGGEIVVTNAADVLSIASATGTTGSLAMVNGSLRAASFYVGRNGLGTFNMSGSATTTCSGVVISSGTTSTGTVVVAGGKMSVSQDLFVGGDAGSGQMVVSNGTVETLRTTVGDNVVGSSTAAGTLTIGGGGKLTAQGSLRMCPSGASSRTSTVWIVGGELDVATNIAEFLTIGEFSRAAMIVSNGTVLVGTGSPASGVIVEPLGQLTLLGGTTRVAGNLEVGGGSGRTGTVLVAGGTLINTNASATLSLGPFFGVARMTVSNATVLARRVQLGTDNNFQGISLLTIGSGGTLAAVGPLVLGTLNDTGQVVVAGGQLVITNTPASVGAGSGFIVDGTVTLTNGSSIVVSNLPTVIGNRGSGSLTNLGGSLLFANLTIGNFAGSQGTLTVAGGTNTVSTLMALGNDDNTTGVVWMTGGQLLMTNAFDTIEIGLSGVGQMTMSSGTVQVAVLEVGLGLGAGLGQGTFTMAGGTNTVLNDFEVGVFTGATGAVWVTGGQLVMTNAQAGIGSSGIGQMTVSNVTVLASNVVVGFSFLSQGTLTVAGGGITLSSFLRAGELGTGTVWLTTGGQLVVTNDTTYIGDDGIGRMTVSNGTLLTRNMIVGNLTDSRGTFTVAGGTAAVSSNLVLGLSACNATGTVVVAGGSLFVTNAGVNAVLEVRSGTLQLNSGILTIDRLVITNACGHFVKTGGTLSITSTNLDPNLSAVGDGIPNSWKQQYGFDPFDPNVAGADPDGDGMSNLQEYLAGSNPLADIKAIKREGDDIRVRWQAAASKTNALQRSPGSNGSYSNNFTDIFIVTNNVGSVTNYLDVGGATNWTTRYYRVRLVP